jgi:hypothetical protein
MKKFAILIISIAIALFVGGVLAQSPGSSAPQPTKVQDEPAPGSPAPHRDHEWLKQLVGEWDVTWKLYMQPDQPPMESAGTDSVRALGDHWIIAETKTTMMGTPYNGILSLGYNALKKQFNGTWIDSFGGQLWVYKGTLNDAGDTMTLETEGPSLQVPDKTARYREVIQMTGKDSRTFTSSMEKEDGTWMKIVTIEYRRTKS